MAGKWRFELFYYDFAIGVMAGALLYAYTLAPWDSTAFCSGTT
jgi:hypothetical protein